MGPDFQGHLPEWLRGMPVCIAVLLVTGHLFISLGAPAQELHGSPPTDTVPPHRSLFLKEVETRVQNPSTLEMISLKPAIVADSLEIQSAPATSGEEVLEYMPLIDLRNRGRFGTQADLSIMAGSFDQSLVLLNGIDMSDPQTGHFHLNLLPGLAATEQFELVTSGAARRFGSHAFSGALNVVTRPDDSTYIRIGSRYGQHAYYKVSLTANAAGNRAALLTSLGTSGSDGYRRNTDFRTSQGFLHAVYGGEKLRSHAMVGVTGRKFGANSFYTPRYPDQYEETTTGIAALKFERASGSTGWILDLYSRFNKDLFLLDRTDPGFYRNNHFTRVAGADLENRLSTVAGVTSTGIHVRSEKILSTSLGEPLDQARMARGAGDVLFTHARSRNSLNWNLNHSVEGRLLSFNGGFLVHLDPGPKKRIRFYPGGELRFRLPKKVRLHASVNRSMRLPTFTDLYYSGPSNQGNPDLLPERAVTFETGLYRNGTLLDARAGVFHRIGRDLIDWIWMEEDQKWHTLNLTRVDASGVTLQMTWRPGSENGKIPGLERADLSYTHTRLSKRNHELVSRYVLDNLRHKAVLAAVFKIRDSFMVSPRLSFQDRDGHYMEYDPLTAESSRKSFHAFLLADIRARYALKHISFHVDMTNMFDTAYQDIGNLVQPGRWISGGFELRF